MTPQQIQDLMARERAFTRAAAAAGLSAEQEALVEQAFRAVNPPDPSAWVSTFVRGLGIGTQPPAAAPAPQAPTAPPAPAAPPSGPSFSDKGPAAATAARDPLAIIQNDPRKATMDDYRRLVAQHGEEKAMRMWADHAMAFWATAKVRPDGRR